MGARHARAEVLLVDVLVALAEPGGLHGLRAVHFDDACAAHRLGRDPQELPLPAHRGLRRAADPLRELADHEREQRDHAHRDQRETPLDQERGEQRRGALGDLRDRLVRKGLEPAPQRVRVVDHPAQPVGAVPGHRHAQRRTHEAVERAGSDVRHRAQRDRHGRSGVQEVRARADQRQHPQCDEDVEHRAERVLGDRVDPRVGYRAAQLGVEVARLSEQGRDLTLRAVEHRPHHRDKAQDPNAQVGGGDERHHKREGQSALVAQQRRQQCAEGGEHVG
ncbi:MAG: hypothetical protein AAGH64_03430 [Planctomycetota bacterium]